MQQINLAIAVSAVTVLIVGGMSAAVARRPLSMPLLAVLVGIAAGPVALGWFRPGDWPNAGLILKEAARFTLAISVMGIALRTPVKDIRRLMRPVGILLSAGMLAMWAVSAGLGLAALGLSPLMALALGAVVTPTDPVVASSIVTGPPAETTLPDRLRSTLSLESGANDGLGYLLVLLPVHLLAHAPGRAWQLWLTETLLVGVVLAVVIGAVLGWLAARFLHLTDGHGWIEEHSHLSYSVALSFAVVSLAKLAGSDGILAAFAAGVAFNLSIDRSEDFEEENVQEAISKLFALPVFVIFGAMVPWEGWGALGPGGLAFAVAVLLLRRPLALLALGWSLGGRLERRELIFLGWFGPVGVAAIYYAKLVEEHTGEAVVWHAASAVIAASIFAHGVTSVLGLRLYAEEEARDGS